MRTGTIVELRRKTLPEWLICLLVLLPFFLPTLNELLQIPRAVRYLTDVAWVLLVLLVLLEWQFRRRLHLTGQTKTLMIWAVAFLVCTGLIYLTRYQSALYYLWGVRNNFRFYAAFFAFAAFLTGEDAQEYLKLFDGLFWLNAAVSLVQFFGMGLKGDCLGGIFGAQKGVNGYTNLFFVIILTRSLVLYLEKKEKSGVFFAKFAAMLLIAALAELKFFFIEALVILVLAVLITGLSWKKLWIMAGGIAAVFVGAVLLSYLFPVFQGWFSLEKILDITLSDRGYTSQGDLNRLNAITQINERWLTGIGTQLLGLGLGNCETANFSFLNTPFFEEYGYLHYNWFSHMHMYLECGWLGLVFTVGFFALIFLYACRKRKSANDTVRIHSIMAMILSVVCVGILIYNSSLRTEGGYMMYFMLALPFIHQDEDGVKSG